MLFGFFLRNARLLITSILLYWFWLLLLVMFAAMSLSHVDV